MPFSSSVSCFLFFIFRKFLGLRDFSPKSFLRVLVFQNLVSYKVVSYKKKTKKTRVSGVKVAAGPYKTAYKIRQIF